MTETEIAKRVADRLQDRITVELESFKRVPDTYVSIGQFIEFTIKADKYVYEHIKRKYELDRNLCLNLKRPKDKDIYVAGYLWTVLPNVNLNLILLKMSVFDTDNRKEI